MYDGYGFVKEEESMKRWAQDLGKPRRVPTPQELGLTIFVPGGWFREQFGFGGPPLRPSLGGVGNKRARDQAGFTFVGSSDVSGESTPSLASTNTVIPDDFMSEEGWLGGAEDERHAAVLEAVRDRINATEESTDKEDVEDRRRDVRNLGGSPLSSRRRAGPSGHPPPSDKARSEDAPDDKGKEKKRRSLSPPKLPPPSPSSKNKSYFGRNFVKRKHSKPPPSKKLRKGDK